MFNKTKDRFDINTLSGCICNTDNLGDNCSHLVKIAFMIRSHLETNCEKTFTGVSANCENGLVEALNARFIDAYEDN